jgi:hypothetical protein
MKSGNRVIIYVPGMKPKPPAEDHRATLWRCLLEGVRRVDTKVAQEMASHAGDFQLVAWPHLFYDMPKDLAEDLPGIERLFRLEGPEKRDIDEARHWHKRLGRLVYLLSDTFPCLIRWVANPDMKATLQDTLRYFKNADGVATDIRSMVADSLRTAYESGARILLLTHSLGSVIAYDVLWEFSRRSESALAVDQFVTLGSPLGLNFVRHRLLSAHEQGQRCYPDNIRSWKNLSAIGEMTALDRVFADDFREMIALGLVDEINDRSDLKTYFRGPDGLNVHKCYGYMVTRELGAVIANWWQRQP